MKLYYFYWRDRGGRISWLLEELGVPYEVEHLNYASKEQKSLKFLEINPLGKIPVLIDGENIIVETGAICTYLADKYRDQGLAPAFGSDRAAYYQWNFFTSATLEPAVLEVFSIKHFPEPEKTTRFKEIKAKVDPLLAFIARGLGNQEYLVNNQFSAADVMVGATLAWAKNTALLTSEHLSLLAYLERLWCRPAYLKARSLGPKEL